MATQSDRIAALEEGMSAILAAIQGKTSDTDDTPKSKAKATAAKAGTVKRNLDPIVLVDDDECGVQVIAAGQAGPYMNGARVLPVVEGKTQRSFTRQTVAFIVDHADEIMEALDAVDERAKIGTHKQVATKSA